VILVREVFKLKIGKAKEAKELFKEAQKLGKKYNYPMGRTMTDLTGPYYTFVWETEFKTLGDWESTMNNTTGQEEFGKWYQKFAALLEHGGRREIFTIVE
jgi:hypothetical protein